MAICQFETMDEFTKEKYKTKIRKVTTFQKVVLREAKALR